MTDSASPAPSSAAAPAAPAKAAKPPAPEDKPFAEFVPGLPIPAIAHATQAYGGPEVSIIF